MEGIRRMQRAVRRRGPGEPGQATVEFALLIPVFLVLILMVLDIGRAYYTTQVLLNAAREGARAGILPEGSSSDVDTAANAVLASASITGATIAHSNAGSGVAMGATTSVTVTYPFQSLTGTFIPGWSGGTITLSQTVQARHE